MLKRPPEKVWKYDQPPDPFPQIPGANGLFLAPSGRGKSTSLIAMLLGPYAHKFARVYIWSPNVFVDSAWDAWKKFNREVLKVPDEEKTMFDEWDEAKLKEIVAAQTKLIKHMKDKKMKKLYAICIVIDDWSDRTDIMKRAGGILTSLFIKGRHSGINTWVSAQALRTIHSVARANFRFICVWKLNNALELAKLLEEFAGVYPPGVVQRMYAIATAGKHDFMYVNLVGEDGPAFYKGFEQRMLYT